MRQYRYDDNFDADGVLRDGGIGHVPMMFRDSGRAVDGSQHRPGFRVTNDAALRDERVKAHREYLHDLENAWRGDARRKKTVERDPEGRLLSEEEQEIDDALPPVRDGRTLDQIRHDHERNMLNIYQAYETSLCDAWRRKP